MDNNIFSGKSEEQAIKFYYTTKGVYSATIDALKDSNEKLDELLEVGYSDKEEIKKLKERIKELKIEVRTLEFLYKCAFD